VRTHWLGRSGLATKAGCPIQARSWLEWDTPRQTGRFFAPLPENIEVRGISLKPKPGLTPISCHAVLDGVMGHPALVASPDLPLKRSVFVNLPVEFIRELWGTTLVDRFVLDVPPANDLGFQQQSGVRDQLEKISFGPSAYSVLNLYG
jgi:hypothetical protein